MGLLKGTTPGLDGLFHSQDRAHAALMLDAIGMMRDAGPGTAALYGGKFASFYTRRQALGYAFSHIGTRLVRKLLGRPRREYFYIKHRQLYDWLAYCYARDGKEFNFDGMRFPMPARKADEANYVTCYFDIIAERLGGGCTAPIRERHSLEGSYELGKVQLREGDVVLDCGANIGFFSALGSMLGCTVHAFEPSRFIREAYTGKVAELNGGICVFPYAVSDTAEKLQFVTDMDNIGGSRIEQLSPDEGNRANSASIETVEAITLDEFVESHGIARVDFIKADIEGAERRMLLGAKNILRTMAPKLSICTYHLPDDPRVLPDIIKSIQPKYAIIQDKFKLFAHV